MDSWLNALCADQNGPNRNGPHDMSYESTESDTSPNFKPSYRSTTEIKTPVISPMVTSQKLSAPISRIQELPAAQNATSMRNTADGNITSVQNTTGRNRRTDFEETSGSRIINEFTNGKNSIQDSYEPEIIHDDTIFMDEYDQIYTNDIQVDYQFIIKNKSYDASMKPISIRRLNQIMDQNAEWFATIQSNHIDYSVIEFCIAVSKMYLTAVFAIVKATDFYIEIQKQCEDLTKSIDMKNPHAMRFIRMIESIQNSTRIRIMLFKEEENQIDAGNLHKAHLFVERKKNQNTNILIGFKDRSLIQRLSQIKVVMNMTK